MSPRKLTPVGAMTIGTIFERGGRRYNVIRRTGANVVIGDQESADTLTISADALGTIERVPELCIFADSPATRAS